MKKEFWIREYFAPVVFKKLCELEAFCLEEWVWSSKDIAESIEGAKREDVRKALTWLRLNGLVKKACIGRPAIETFGEYRELVCEAKPPKKGWTLTDLGLQSPEFKEAYKAFEDSMREWAEGEYDEGTD